MMMSSASWQGSKCSKYEVQIMDRIPNGGRFAHQDETLDPEFSCRSRNKINCFASVLSDIIKTQVVLMLIKINMSKVSPTVHNCLHIPQALSDELILWQVDTPL